jgi:hypothetical protein
VERLPTAVAMRATSMPFKHVRGAHRGARQKGLSRLHFYLACDALRREALISAGDAGSRVAMLWLRGWHAVKPTTRGARDVQPPQQGLLSIHASCGFLFGWTPHRLGQYRPRAGHRGGQISCHGQHLRQRLAELRSALCRGRCARLGGRCRAAAGGRPHAYERLRAEDEALQQRWLAGAMAAADRLGRRLKCP